MHSFVTNGVSVLFDFCLTAGFTIRFDVIVLCNSFFHNEYISQCKVTTKKWNAEEYGNGFDLQGFHLRCQLFREPLQSTPKPNQDGATLLVRNHAQ